MSGYHIATEHKLQMLEYTKTDECQRLLLSVAADALALSPGSKQAIKAAGGWLGGIRIGLEEGVPYYWSPECCEALMAAAPKVPDLQLRREDVPSPAGYMYFARPLKIDRSVIEDDDLDFDVDQREELALGDMTAVQWVMYDEISRTWEDTSDAPLVSPAETPELASGLSVNIYCATKRRPGGVPISSFSWDFNESFYTMWQRRHQMLGPDGKPVFSDVVLQELQYLAAALLFMQQEIFPTRREQLPRDTRKRLLRAGYDPGSDEMTPRVVYLRRVTQRPNDDTQHDVREYSHRFWVKGHWRNQWYESEGRHKPKWIHPFIKGPEDKPIAARRDTLVAVVR